MKADSYPNIMVLATYASSLLNTAAILEINIGKGRVILSGVHCEFAPELFDISDPILLSVQKKIAPKDLERQALMSHLLDCLGVRLLSKMV